MKMLIPRFGNILVLTAGAALIAVSVSAAEAATVSEPAVESAPAVLAVKPSVGTLPANFKPSPALDEVIRLAQAGVGDEVLLAYIANANRDFSPSSEEIIFLHDLGVSEPVITALIKSKPGTSAAVVAKTQLAPTNPAPAMNGVVAQPAPAGQPEAVVVTEPPQQVTVNYFYDSLAPYGSWVQVADYGWCWQPTVAVVNVGWQPYCDRGRWLWTSSGWYWQSDYSWGWAPFHYGRWYHHPRHSWVWVPDTMWGPSWVSWRYSSSYCGWAPLPPAAHFRAGFGFSWHNGAVGIGFEFGLGYGHYTYVPANRFCERNPYAYRIHGDQVRAVHSQTTVINNYVTGNNNTIINNGAGRDAIAKVTPRPIPTIAIRDEPQRTGPRHHSDRIVTEGAQQVVYRPTLPQKPPTVSQLARSESEHRASMPAPRRSVEQIVSDLHQSVPAPIAERNVYRPVAKHTGGGTSTTVGVSVPTRPSQSPVPGVRNDAREARTRFPAPGQQPETQIPPGASTKEQRRTTYGAPSQPNRTITVPAAPVQPQAPVAQPAAPQIRRPEVPREYEHRTPRNAGQGQPGYQPPVQYQAPAPQQRSYSPAPTPRAEPSAAPSRPQSSGGNSSPRDSGSRNAERQSDRPGRP